jgi:hypothetical protein
MSSERLIDQALVIAASSAIHFSAEPLDNPTVQANRDLFCRIWSRYDAPVLRLAEIVFALHCEIGLLAFEWVAVLGLDSGGYFAA